VTPRGAGLGAVSTAEALYDLLDERTLELLQQRQQTLETRRRGWLVRRALVAADLVGLSVAFLVVEYFFVHRGGADHVNETFEYLTFFVSLPGWILVAKLYGLYERDEERTDHTTVEDMTGVFHLLTIGVWLFFGLTVLTHIASPQVSKLFTFWLVGIVLVAAARIVARTYCRRDVRYLQNTVIVGAGDVGQLVARKLLQHREYGLNLVGFVDDEPRERRVDLEWLTVLGSPDELPEIVRLLDVERVIFAFSTDRHERVLEVIRSLNDLDVQVDVVPRLFEIVTPTTQMHTIETLPVMSLRPTRPARSSRMLKRGLDVVVSSTALVLTAPLFAFIAWKIHRDSEGPVFFRQTRLGVNQQPFTALKFRTMRVGTSSEEHEEHVRRSVAGVIRPESNGLFKLERVDDITASGRWLRKTSLDELPQLINVLRGEMSLVGPRPCLTYEVAYFSPHHFERFDVPAGITGLWQVTARAHATFKEALDMDVAYVRGWSLGLDMRLLFRTPMQVLRPRATR
jgi:exopolysaccharide biosynthesis polyprenyl glycosylphosphotransferase